MLIGEVISSIKEFLSRGISSDDVRWSDPFIYFQTLLVRARLLKNKKDKFQELSPFSYQTLECFPLVWTTLYDCPCYDVDCKFLVSKYNIPDIVGYRNGLLIDTVRTLGGRKIDRIDVGEITYLKDTRTKKNGLYWFIHNNKLVIVGSSKLKVVTVRAIFIDPLQLNDIPVCDEDGEETYNPCYDPHTTDFPIEKEMIDDLEKMVIEKIKKMGEPSPQDNENNAQASEIVSRGKTE